MPTDMKALTKDDQRLLDQALSASTETLYEIEPASPPAVPGMPEEEIALVLSEELWTEHGEIRGTAECVERILSLIRPAFEAMERAHAHELDVAHSHIEDARAKLAQAVEATKAVLAHRVGDMPSSGYLRDNAASRKALADLAATLATVKETP